MENITKKANIFGMVALFIWAIEPLLVSEIDGLPIFETLSIIFGSCFLFTAVRITIKKKWKEILKQPLFLWILGVTCICGSDFAYILGAECAPIAHVDLIDYIWPCFVVIFVSMLPHEKLHPHQLLGSLVGMLGILFLVTSNVGLEEQEAFNFSYYFYGYILAFYGAMMWAAYAPLTRHFNKAPAEMVGMYCGVGTIICLIFHFCLEETVAPSMSQIGLASTLGIVGAGIAYQLWDFGLKFGNFKLLSSLTYLARILAMVLLVTLDKEPFSWQLVIAVLLSCFGIFLTTVSKDYLLSKMVLVKSSIFWIFKRKNSTKDISAVTDEITVTSLR